MRLLLACMLMTAVGCGGKDAVDRPDAGASGPADAPPLSGERYAVEFGPIVVAPGREDTRCMNIRLSNSEAIKVHQMRNLLSDGSHHLIVYKVDDPAATESTEPFECTPFAGALNLSGTSAPIMITQKHIDALSLPDRVAYTFAPGQMMRIEMHYINTTDDPLSVSATSEFYAVPAADIDHEANILFIGTPDIALAGGEMAEVHAYFRPKRASLDLTGAKFFAVTGHTHQYGLGVTVALAESTGGPRTPIYAPEPFEWAEPETTVHAPEFQVPAGAGAGFDITCRYHNTSGEPVGFGESANDEMCFFWAYYYPSKGSHVCVNATYEGGQRRHLLPRRRPAVRPAR